MSSNRKLYTDTKVDDCENTDSGFLSGPITDDCDYRHSQDDKQEVELDSGLDLLSEKCVSDNEVHSPTAQQTPVPSVSIVEESAGDLPPLALLLQQDEDGDTQLHIAAVHGCEKTISSLIKICPEKVWLDLRNDYGQTALHLAACSGHAIVTRMLVKAGADIGITDVTGSTPLHLAAAQGHLDCIKALLSPVPEYPTRRISTILNQKDYNGQMAVHVAARNGHKDALRILVFFGADINEREGLSGWTALHISGVRGDPRTARFLINKCSGVSVDAEDFSGRTAARYARRTAAAPAFHKYMDDTDSEDEDDDEDRNVNEIVESLNTINVA